MREMFLCVEWGEGWSEAEKQKGKVEAAASCGTSCDQQSFPGAGDKCGKRLEIRFLSFSSFPTITGTQNNSNTPQVVALAASQNHKLAQILLLPEDRCQQRQHHFLEHLRERHQLDGTRLEWAQSMKWADWFMDTSQAFFWGLSESSESTGTSLS